MRLVLACLLSGVVSLRKGTSQQWESQADGVRGVCSDAIAPELDPIKNKGDIPMRVPVFCTGWATGVMINATAFGYPGASLDIFVDGELKTSAFWGWGWEQTLFNYY